MRAVFVSWSLILLAGASPSFAAPAAPGRLLVRFSDRPDLDQRWAERVTEVGRKAGVELSLVRPLPWGWVLAKHPARRNTGDIATRLEALPEVEATSPDWIYEKRLRPDDDDLDQQWNLTAIRAEEAWDLTVGTPAERIGVVDTGIRRNHRDLDGRVVAGHDFISDPDEAMDGDARDSDYEDDFDRADCDGVTVDGDHHGSHIVGVIAANTDNGRGTAGVSWGAQVVVARALGRCGRAALSDVLDAVAWLAGRPVADVPALEGGPVQVVNLSFGRDGACSAPERDLAADLAGRGLWVVAPTGNSGGAVEAPANCDQVIAVAAHGSTPSRALAPYASAQGQVDLVAPGGNLSEGPEGGVLSSDGSGRNNYAFREGTSIAAAHVSGALSLIRSVRPDLTRRQTMQALSLGGVGCDGCGAVPALDLRAALDIAVGLPVVAPEGAPCDAGVTCDEGLSCADLDGTAVCRPACDASSGAGCPADHHCLPTEGLFGEAVCFPAGPMGPGGPCQQGPDCATGHVCVMDADSGVSLCQPQCNHGFICPDATFECVTMNPFQSFCAPAAAPEPPPVEAPPPVTEPPAPEVEDTSCRLSLGNLDCKEGLGCLEDHDGDDVGFCGPWTGIGAGGAACGARYTCASGLCEQGVCLLACADDGGCPGGWSCGVDLLCHPEPCTSGSACSAGWSCEESGGSPVCLIPEGGCRAVHPVDADEGRRGGWPLAALALIAVGALRRTNRAARGRSPLRGCTRDR